VRYKESHDLAASRFATIVLTMNGKHDPVGARSCLGAVAPIPWRSTDAEQGAGRQAPQRSGPPRRRARRRSAGGEAAPAGTAYKVQIHEDRP